MTQIPISMIDDKIDDLSTEQAQAYMQSSKPTTQHLHMWRPAALYEGNEGNEENKKSDESGHLLVVNGSRLFDITPKLQQQIEAAIDSGDEAALLTRLGIDGAPMIDDTPLTQPKTYAFSLAVAQKCNLGCTYCYAQQGEFGGTAKNMPLETALQAVDVLVDGVDDGGRFNLAFMGGEPLVNRKVLRQATLHAVKRAKERAISVSFSITTNGTLLRQHDAVFFEEHGFAVTISLDGVGETHDALRPYKGGKGSYELIMKNVRPLLAIQKHMQVSARVTVTPKNLSLLPILDTFLAEGFHSVGFSPMLSAPNGQDEMGQQELAVMLEQMIECGKAFERHTLAGKRYAFANMNNAMREIDKGTHRPYPCGAGAGYMGVSANGELSACHRFVDDDDGLMGTLDSGIDTEKQTGWLADRHVHQQQPCQTCWARYLCGGGCHHEVIGRGRMACDYVRGWLQYCMEAYLRLAPLLTRSKEIEGTRADDKPVAEQR